MSHHASSSDEYWSNFIESMVETICERLDSISGNLDRIATQLEADSIERSSKLGYPEEDIGDGREI